jgi:serine/threonine protein kinase
MFRKLNANRFQIALLPPNALSKSLATKADLPSADTQNEPSAVSGQAADLERPDIRAKYEVLEEEARGGMGVVFRARHRSLDMPVAIKILLPGESSGRFLREAKLLASVRSPHVVVVYDYDILPDGRSMICMEWIEERSAESHTGKRKTLESQALPWMLQSARGMQDAAELGIVHRDLKPSNILIRSKGTACVADFDLRRELG